VTPSSPAKRPEITERFVRRIRDRLAENKRVRRNLPEWGRVHIDRALPFVCVYRRPPHRRDEGTHRLVTTEASYITAVGAARRQPGLAALVDGIAATLSEQFGAFLVLEVWSAPKETVSPPEDEETSPGFRVFVPGDRRLDALAESLEKALSRFKQNKRSAEVTVLRRRRCRPPRMPALITPSAAREVPEADGTGVVAAGIEVRPTYRDPEENLVFPLRLRRFRRLFSRALQRAFFDFSRAYTTHHPKHYHMLGKRAMVKAVWEVDRRLGDVAEQFDLLLLSTPVNSREAWHRFRRARFEKPPVFRYRPLPVDPVVLKRHLYAAPIERVEDSAVYLLLRQKQDELDRHLTMLLDINTPRFLPGSIQIYGAVSDKLATIAAEIMSLLPARAREKKGQGSLDATGFARRAEEEIVRYRSRWPDLEASVQIRPDLNSGLMVSRGRLLVGSHARVPAARVDALIQHEVGTHVLTFYNGKAQPLRQLSSGLAGYEALQEGLAVLSEYLVDGLSRPRLRLLAARVLAARFMTDGATFIDCFRMLNRDHGLEQSTAYTVTMRVYRGGGLTKDAVYLLGLNQLLGYLNDGGSLEPLYLGKIAAEHVPIVEELRWRGVLRAPPLAPSYLDRPEVADRLARVRRYENALDLVKEEYR